MDLGMGFQKFDTQHKADPIPAVEKQALGPISGKPRATDYERLGAIVLIATACVAYVVIAKALDWWL